MNLIIEIHYTGASKLMQTASFTQCGLSPERIALDWWKQIQKEMSYHATLEKVILNSEEDITEKVKLLERERQLKSYKAVEDLPF